MHWPDGTEQAVFDLVVVFTWLLRELVWLLRLLRARREAGELQREVDTLRPGGLGATPPVSAADPSRPTKQGRDGPPLSPSE